MTTEDRTQLIRHACEHDVQLMEDRLHRIEWDLTFCGPSEPARQRLLRDKAHCEASLTRCKTVLQHLSRNA